MARLTPPDVSDLATFAGEDPDGYGDFAETALSQATILFEVATGLDSSSYPDAGTVNWDLANNGILEMANALYMSQPYLKVLASPFQSENIGSYSYSKMAAAVMAGVLTGLAWFDRAVALLAITTTATDVTNTAVTLYENDSLVVQDERRYVMFPEENMKSFGAEPYFTGINS